MSYMALARRYRPRRFDDVLGQPSVVRALRNALEGVHLDHQATDYDEITPEEFTSRTLGK